MAWKSRSTVIRVATVAFVALGFIYLDRLAHAAANQAAAAPPAKVTIEKPRAMTVTGGHCGVLGDGATLSGTWGPPALPAMAFTIGPGSAMADQMHASKTKFTGPGRYPNVIVALYLGKTALEDSYGGLGTIVVSPDGKSGTFVLNDGKASGRFDCGAPPSR